MVVHDCVFTTDISDKVKSEEPKYINKVTLKTESKARPVSGSSRPPLPGIIMFSLVRTEVAKINVKYLGVIGLLFLAGCLSLLFRKAGLETR